MKLADALRNVRVDQPVEVTVLRQCQRCGQFKNLEGGFHHVEGRAGPRRKVCTACEQLESNRRWAAMNRSREQ